MSARSIGEKYTSHWQIPHSDKTTSQDLATSPLISPENGLAVVYSRHSRLREPYGNSLWHKIRFLRSRPRKSARAAWAKCIKRMTPSSGAM